MTPHDVHGGTRFAFDLDGTVTRAEILPAIAREAGLFSELSLLTRMTLDGAIDFATSFRLRFDILRAVPVATVQKIVAAIPLDPHIEAFIIQNSHACAIVTGNLDCWIEPVTNRLGCAVYCSRSAVKNGELRLASIVDKAEAIREMQRGNRRVVAVGDAANDIPMFEAADFSIVYAGIREPAQTLLTAADRVERDAATLCAFLATL